MNNVDILLSIDNILTEINSIDLRFFAKDAQKRKDQVYVKDIRTKTAPLNGNVIIWVLP